MKKVYLNNREANIHKASSTNYDTPEEAEKTATRLNVMFGNMRAAEVYNKMTGELIGYGVFDEGMCEEEQE